MKLVMLGGGILAAAVLLFAATIVASNRALGDDDSAAAAAGTTGAADGPHGHDRKRRADGQGQSFAGAAPANAAELAKAHQPYPAELPPLTAGDVVKVHMVLKDVTIEIAPGVKYAAWGFEGGAPGPVVHARQGQTVEMTLTNDGAIPHSIDFHAARIAPNLAFVDVMPGKSFTFRFKANDPGVFMYHCGTKPVLMHIANGMYGAIVVDPGDAAAEGRPLVRSRRERVVPDERRPRRAGPVRHQQGTGDDARLDDLQRLRRPVRRRIPSPPIRATPCGSTSSTQARA